MERREALKNIGFGSMGLFASTALFGALQGCSSTPEVNWKPLSMTAAQAARLEKFTEAVLPETDTPGANQAGVAKHLDKAMSTIYQDKDVEYIKSGMSVFASSYDGNYDNASTEDLTAAINAYFKDIEQNPEKIRGFQQEYGKEGKKSREWLEYFFVTNVVDATFFSYFTSELVGETVMRYDPIPGEYKIIDYKTGESAWSSV